MVDLTKDTSISHEGNDENIYLAEIKIDRDISKDEAGKFN